MTVLDHVFDGSADNFQQLVVENSKKGAVLVNYWKPDAGPCFKLWQALETLVQENQGRFLLVNINTDRQAALVREQGIASVPTVKIYYGGNVVESIYGAESETSLRGAIDKYVPQAANRTVGQAVRSYQAGRVDEALALLAKAGGEEPDNLAIHSTTIKLLLREKRYLAVESYLSGLSDSVRTQPDIKTLQVHAKMLHLAQLAPAAEKLDERLRKAPDDLNAALSRAAVALVEDDYETALTRLLHVLRVDRCFCDELPQKAMLVIFSLLGPEHELSRTFREALRAALQD